MNMTELLQQTFNATEEQVSAFLEAMKTNKIFTASEENMDIRYGKLKKQHETKDQQLKDALAKIATLESGTAGGEALQQELTAAQAENTALKTQLEQTQIDAAVHVELLSAGVKPDDIDYVMYKLKAKGQLERGEDGRVKDIDDKIAALKTQLPGQFAAEGKKVFQEHKLPKEEPDGGKITREDFNKMGYNSRVALRQENPELYDQMMKG